MQFYEDSQSMQVHWLNVCYLSVKANLFPISCHERKIVLAVIVRYLTSVTNLVLAENPDSGKHSGRMALKEKLFEICIIQIYKGISYALASRLHIVLFTSKIRLLSGLLTVYEGDSSSRILYSLRSKKAATDDDAASISFKFNFDFKT